MPKISTYVYFSSWPKAPRAGYLPFAHAKRLLAIFICFTPCQHTGANQLLLLRVLLLYEWRGGVKFTWTVSLADHSDCSKNNAYFIISSASSLQTWIFKKAIISCECYLAWGHGIYHLLANPSKKPPFLQHNHHRFRSLGERGGGSGTVNSIIFGQVTWLFPIKRNPQPE